MVIKVLIADDHKIISESLVPILNAQPDIEVIEFVHDGRAAVEKTLQHRPDIVIMDIAMPELSGIEATREIIEKYPEAKIIILSMHDDRRYVVGALEAGALGYLTKGCSLKELFAAIYAVKDNKRYLSPEISSIIITSSGVKTPDNAPSLVNTLTAREKEVLKLLAEGHSIKEISFKLNLSVKTIHAHRANIMQKLNITNTPSLVKYAIREGIISIQP